MSGTVEIIWERMKTKVAFKKGSPSTLTMICLFIERCECTYRITLHFMYTSYTYLVSSRDKYK